MANFPPLEKEIVTDVLRCITTRAKSFSIYTMDWTKARLDEAIDERLNDIKIVYAWSSLFNASVVDTTAWTGLSYNWYDSYNYDNVIYYISKNPLFTPTEREFYARFIHDNMREPCYALWNNYKKWW